MNLNSDSFWAINLKHYYLFQNVLVNYMDNMIFHFKRQIVGLLLKSDVV